MKILVINSGSSSLKYQLIDVDSVTILAKGLCDRIGIQNSFIKQSNLDGKEFKNEVKLHDHNDAIKVVINLLIDKEHGVIKSMDEISAVGHRVVHGGERFYKSVIIDDDVLNAIEESIELAPLHNGPNMIGIKACKKIMPSVPMVAVFDTAFHQTMPEKAYIYALPYSLYEENGIRSYGFHGTSHRYVSERAAAMLDKPYDSLCLVLKNQN